MSIEQAARRPALAAGAAALAFLAAAWLLAPILTPFLLAAVAAYACNPIVGRLARWGVPRAAGATLTLIALLAAAVAVLLILVPLVSREMGAVIARAPAGIALFNERAAPFLLENFGFDARLDAAWLTRLARENWDTLQGLLPRLLDSLRIGGLALAGLLVNLLLTPVVMFYLLCDWDAMLERLGQMVPRAWQPQAARLAGEIDAVLGRFLRGQFLVMLSLAIYYSAGLSLAGVASALPLGVLTGMLIFVPYLGFATGFLLALLVAALQLQGLGPVTGVLIVYGVGQALESFLLTPWLVGSRVGLHPLAVIFALMAFGQLFGFLGVLLALPAAAAIAVGLRELHRRLLASAPYREGK
ncbi:MAG: AI-2E family transporter [Rhodocyclaceae bacterium]